MFNSNNQRDLSDLSYNTVKIDYETLRDTMYAAVGAHHLLMEDYRRRGDAHADDLFRELQFIEPNPSEVLHHTIGMRSDAESLLDQTKMFARAVNMLHILLGAMNRTNVTVVNTPLEGTERTE